MVEKPKTYYDDLLLKLSPHFSQMTFKHSIPMNELIDVFKSAYTLSQKKLAARKTIYKERLKSERNIDTITELNEEIKRIDTKQKEKWTINQRSIKVHDFLGLKHSLGTHHCSRIEITPKSMKIDSAYTPTALTRLLKKIFNGCSNIESISFHNYNWIEIKTAVPIEFIHPGKFEATFPGKRRQEYRPNIQTHYYAEIEPGLTVKCYSLTGKKPFFFMKDENLRVGYKSRDKTEILLVKPLEFRFHLSKNRFRKSISSKAKYSHIVKSLKEYLLCNFLFDSDKQAKILFLKIPDLWRNSYCIEGDNTYNISCEDEIYTKSYEYKRSHPEYKPKLKNPKESMWTLEDYKYNITRIDYIHQLLDNPYFKVLKKDWEKKFRYILHSDLHIQLKQLEYLLLLGQVRNYGRSKLNDSILEHYVYWRTYYSKRYKLSKLNKLLINNVRSNSHINRFKEIDRLIKRNNIKCKSDLITFCF